MPKNRIADTVADMESIVKDASSPQNICKFGDKAVRVHIHSVRKRSTDPDGVSCKAALDGVVESGVLDDDNSEIIQSVTFSQEKGDDERTIIEITEC